MQRLA
ncbi:putative membrane protein, partial [Vibrio parahaemolyticus EKP-008]